MGPLPHPVHVSQRRDVGASCGALRLRGAAVRCGQRMENSRKVGWTGAPTIVPKVCYGNPVPPAHFPRVPDPSADAPRLGCCRLRGRPRRPGRRAGGRDEMPVFAGLRAVGAVVPDVPAAAPAPVWLPHRRSRRRHPIRPPLAPVLPRPQFCKAPGETLHGPGSGPKFASRPSRSPIRYGSTISRCVKRLLGAISLSFFIWRTAARPPALEILAGSMPYIVAERI